ncbi:MAG: tetratricopeptide repeat protein [Saprospiraceae bacterium]|nr:tetratricopeptide repeat protein [Saprospiraceae bacterium]
MIKKISLIFILTLSITLSKTAVCQVQIKRDIVKESEVKLQEKFLEAQREKLIGNLEKSYKLVEEVYNEDKQNAAVAFELSQLASMLSNNEQALTYGELSVKLDPKNIWYAYHLADVYEELGKFNEAATLCGSYIKIYSTNEELYHRQAFYYSKANNPTAAIATYDLMEKKMGLNPEICKQRHSLYLIKGDAKNALNELQRLVKAYPDNTTYLQWLADYYVSTNDYNHALETYQKIISIDNTDTKAALFVAQSGVSQNKVPSNSEFENLKKIFANKGGDIDAKIARMLPFINEMDSNKSNPSFSDNVIELAQILCTTHPDNAKSYSIKGDVFFYANQLDSALVSYQAATKLDRNVYTIWDQQMQIYGLKKDYASLYKKAQEVIDLFPNQVMPYIQSGLASIQMGKYKESIADLEQAQIMSSHNPKIQLEVLNLLALAYNNSGQNNKAIESYEKALKTNPKSYAIMNSYAFMLARRKNNLERSKELNATALSAEPQNPSMLATQALICFIEKDVAKAKTITEQAMKNGGEKNPILLELKGDISFSEGNINDALEFWNKAYHENPTNQILKKKIDEKKMIEY